LWRERIFAADDLPYRTQLVPLAAILVSLGSRWEDHPVRAKVRRWFWCGVMGELYGSAIESRFARDLPEVVAWALEDGPLALTVLDGGFNRERLLSMRSRQSAAYKGLHALIMQQAGAPDWRTGATLDEQTYFDQAVDIHHIFPRAWCERQGVPASLYNCIINKTALSGATNRQLGGDAPSVFLRRLQARQGLADEAMDRRLAAHLIDPTFLRGDDLLGMLERRAEQLAAVVSEAIGREVGGTIELARAETGPDNEAGADP
jgi:hypothetical protein